MIDEVYRIVPNPKDIENPDAQMCIQILKGPFANSIIQYGRFKVKDVENAKDPNEVMAEFEYDIVGIPEEIKGVEFTDEQGEEFESMVGDILIDLLQKKVEDEELEEANNNAQDRETDTVTLNIL